MTKTQSGATAFLKISRPGTITSSQKEESDNYSSRISVDKTGRRFGQIETFIQNHTAKLAEIPL